MGFNFLTELGKITPKISEGAKIYVYGTGPNWDNICKQYMYLVNCDIDEYVDGFIVRDSDNIFSTFHGKRVFYLSEVDLDNSVILIATATWSESQELLKYLLPHKLYCMNTVILPSWNLDILMRYEYSRLLQYKDKHDGGRCFIIGNGPSLSINDLDKLKNEITFATNKIYLLFDKTLWRPSYYVCEDDALFVQIQDEISMHIKCPAFYSRETILRVDKEFKLANFYFYYLDHRCDWRPNGKPTFSEEAFAIQWGATVTYTCLQLAAYMGFSEIYLLGVDNTTKHGVKLNGELVSLNMSQTHFSSDYMPTNVHVYPNLIDVVDMAYTTAREYAESHDIKILNATRSGALEVFERIDFDSII